MPIGLGPLSAHPIAGAISATSAPTLDGSATGIHSSSNTCSATLSTTKTNDIIVAICVCELGTGAPAVTSVSGGGLTWTKRKAVTAGSSNSTATELWWALAPSALASTTITANYASNFDDACLIVFGVNGCSTTTPWDPNTSVPATSATTGTAAPSFSGISTTNVDDFLIIGWGAQTSGSSTAVPTGWTNIATSNNFSGSSFSAAGVAYERTSAALSSATVTWGGTIGGNPAAIFDALTADASPITLRGAGTGTNTSGSSATPSLPTGIAAGDVSILSAVGSTGTTVFTPPAGWTTIINTTDFLLCWRAWQSGDGNPTVTATGQSWSSYEIITYSGCDTAAPIDQANWCFQMDGSGHMSPALRAPSVAPKYADGRLVCFYGLLTSSSGQTITLPGGLTSELAYTAGPSLYIGDKAIASSSATGNFDAATVFTGKAQWGVQVLLKASGASTVTQAAAFINEGGVYQSPTTASPTSPVTVNLARMGAQTGDLVALAVYTQASSLTGPSGWTQQQSSTDGALFTHVQAAGDTTSPTFALGSSSPTAYEVLLLRNSIATDTRVVGMDTTGQNTATSSTTVSSSSLTPSTTADFLALFVGSKQSTGGIWSVSSGPTRDTYNSGGNANAFAWENPSANPSGTFTWTNGNSQATATAWTLLAQLQTPAIAVTGDSSTAHVGTLGLTRTLALSGTVATAAVGSVKPAQALSGTVATAAVGTLGLTRTLALSGTVATAAVGALKPTQALASVSSTSHVGTLGATHAADITGAAATAAVGNTVANDSISGQIDQLGIATTGHPGTVGSTRAIALPGISAMGQVGTIAPTHSVGVSGVAATGAVGTVGVVSGVTVSLTGVATAGAVATPTAYRTLATLGNSASVAVGSLISTQALSGTHSTGTVGAVGPTRTIALSGNQATSVVGTTAAGTRYELIGNAAQGVAGTAVVGYAVPLAHVSALGSPGVVSANANDRTINLAGTGSVAAVGALSPGLSRIVQGTVTAGQLGNVAQHTARGLSSTITNGHVGQLTVGTAVDLLGTKAACAVGNATAGDLSGAQVFTRERATMLHMVTPDNKVFVGVTSTAASRIFVRRL